MKSSKFGGLSLEDLQEDLPGEGEGEGSSEVEVMEVFEPEQIEGDSTSDADVIEDAIAEVDEVGEGLESLKEALSVSLADGGMTQQSAMFASLAYQGLTGKWVAGDASMPAMESFDEAGGRLQATTYALESIGETLKAWWEKLKAMVNKWVDAVLTFVQKHLSQAARLEASAKKLAKKARESGSEKKKEAEIELDGSEIQNLTEKHGEKVSLSEVSAGLKRLADTAKAAASRDSIVALTEKFANGIGKNAYTDESAKETITTIDLDHAESVLKSAVGGEVRSDSTEYVKYIVSKPFLGNRVAVAKVIGDKDKQVSSIVVGLQAVDKKAKFTKEKVEALSGAEAAKLAEEVAAIAATIGGIKADANKRRQEMSKLRDVFDKAAKALDKSNWEKDHKAQYSAAKGKIAAYSSLAMSTMQPDLDLQKQSMASARAAYNYALKSVKNLEKA